MYENVMYNAAGQFTSRGTWRHPDNVIHTTEIILVTCGTFSMRLGEEVFTLAEGDVLRVDPGIPHGGASECREQVSFFWLHVTGFPVEAVFPTFFHPRDSVQARLLARELLHYANTEGYPTECADCLARVFLIELSARSAGEGGAHKLYAEVCEWVRVNCDLPLRVADVAAHFGYNPDYLNRLFRARRGERLKNYIDACKTERIRRDLLLDDAPLAELAARYSFPDYKTFLKYFRYHTGLTPTQYRRSFANTHTNNR